MPDGLDMSHEDIQRTLQANMPLPAAAASQSKAHNGHHQPQQQPHPAAAAHAHHPHPVDLNPMDFIEHDVVAPPPPPPSAQTTTADSRNFEMNLDAFDVFGDFSDLQQESNGGGGHYGQQHQQQPHLNKIKRGDAEHLAQITEYSPDWAWSDVSDQPAEFESETFKKATGTSEPPFVRSR